MAAIVIALAAVAMGLVAALVGLLVGLGGALVGLVAGLGGGLVGLVVSLGAGMLGLLAGIAAAVVHVLRRLTRPLVVVGFLAAALLAVRVAASRHQHAAGFAGRLGWPTSTVTTPVVDGEDSLPAEAPPPGLLENLTPRRRILSYLDAQFEADIYPSEASAVRALARQVGRQLDSVAGQAADLDLIELRGEVDEDLLVKAANVVREFYPEVKVTTVVGGRDSEAPPGGQSVVIRIRTDRTAERMPGGKERLLTARAQMTGLGRETTHSVRFVHKPWVDDTAAFAASNPGHNWIVAVSEQPAMSLEEADRQALKAAVRKLEAMVLERLGQAGIGRDRMMALGYERLEGMVLAELRSNQAIKDRFTQRVQRPYGEIWQAAVLVDAEPQLVSQIADKCREMLAVQRQHWRQTAWSVAGVVLLVCVVYVFLNSATKGYFVWSLRAAAVAMLAAGVFLMLLFRR